MYKPKAYLETTMFSMYYGQETTPEYRQHKADAKAIDEVRRLAALYVQEEAVPESHPVTLLILQ
jgi:hypothetical protein